MTKAKKDRGVENPKRNTIFDMPVFDKPICDRCRNELLDESTRRYFFPFIGCNECGLFFSTAHNNPKPFFDICEECEKEYSSPNSRRYKYPFICCSKCGPRIKTDKVIYENFRNAFEDIAKALESGEVVILKTSNMFYFICNGLDEKCVENLRKIKKTFKPLPVIFRDINMLKKYVNTNETLETKGTLDVRIIKQLGRSRLASNIGGGSYLAISLANDPFFVLIFKLVEFPLVFSSVNISSESPYTQDQEVLLKFSESVKHIFLNELEIRNVQDFTVVYNELGVCIRRGIGKVGKIIEAEHDFKNCVCLGAELESSICVAKDRKIFLSTRLGHLMNSHVLKTYEAILEDLLKNLGSELELVVCDLHPYYISTQIARRISSERRIPLKQVQHHKAHFCSLIIDRKIEGKLIGFSFDGTGYGEDGNIWGGEIFLGDIYEQKRVGHFRYIPIVAGDAAIENPVLVALSYVAKHMPEKIHLFRQVSKLQRETVIRQIQTNTNVFFTSSVGRLFDIAAVLLRIKEDEKIAFSGQAAIELENLAYSSQSELHLPFDIFQKEDGVLNIDLMRTFQAIIEKREHERYADIARMFHNTIVEALYKVAVQLRDKYGVNKVGFSGGVFQNKILCYGIIKRFKDFQVYFHREVPPNDSGIALGQLTAALR